MLQRTHKPITLSFMPFAKRRVLVTRFFVGAGVLITRPYEETGACCPLLRRGGCPQVLPAFFAAKLH